MLIRKAAPLTLNKNPTGGITTSENKVMEPNNIKPKDKYKYFNHPFASYPIVLA